MAAARRTATTRDQRTCPPLTAEEEALHNFRVDAKRKQYNPPPAKKIADVLSSLLARSGHTKLITHGNLANAWQQSLSANLAKHTRIGAVKRGILEVIVRNSAVLQELTFDKLSLLKRLQSNASDQNIKDLRFRVGAIE
jgi:predicted nucleic acid-binding Zn ribbon protein